MIKPIQVGQRVRAAYIDHYIVNGIVEMVYDNYRGHPAYIVVLDKPIRAYNIVHNEVAVAQDQILHVLENFEA